MIDISIHPLSSFDTTQGTAVPFCGWSGVYHNFIYEPFLGHMELGFPFIKKPQWKIF